MMSHEVRTSSRTLQGDRNRFWKLLNHSTVLNRLLNLKVLECNIAFQASIVCTLSIIYISEILKLDLIRLLDYVKICSRVISISKSAGDVHDFQADSSTQLCTHKVYRAVANRKNTNGDSYTVHIL